jgi:hypothetical protein
MKTILHLASAAAPPRLFCTFALGLLLATTGVAADNPGKGNNNGKGKGKGQSADFVPPGQSDKTVPPGLSDKAIPPGHRRAPIEFVVTKAPPPFRVETVPARPSAGHVWVPGFWAWESDAYVWMPGAWMAPPEPAAVWVIPRFEQRSGVSVYISGYWRL